MAEDALRRNLERAFVAPPDFPDQLLLSRTMAAIPAEAVQPLRRVLPRLSPRFIAAALVVILAAATFGIVSVLRRSAVPTTVGGTHVIFPTKMISSTEGWAVTESGGGPPHVWRTTDGGFTWNDTALPVLPGPPVYEHRDYFLDGDHAWITEILGGAAGSTSYSIVTFRTVDGGKTWQHGTSLVRPTSPTDTTQFFLDANSGWLVTNTSRGLVGEWPDVYATADGGLHWTLVASKAGDGIGPTDLSPGYAQPMFVSPSTGWLTIGLFRASTNGSFLAHGLVLVTHDGGRSWEVQKLPVVPADASSFDAPVFLDQLHGFIVLRQPATGPAARPVLIRTSDGGRTWSARALDWEFLWSIEFVDARHGWAVAGPSADFTKQPNDAPATILLPLYHTDDGGATWTAVQGNLDLMSGRNRVTEVHFVDQTTGFATVWGDDGPKEFRRTTDGGRTWSLVNVCTKPVGLTYPPPPC